jgi:hypothetical protein
VIVEDQARIALLILQDHEMAACQVRGRLSWRLVRTTDTTKLAPSGRAARAGRGLPVGAGGP